MLSSLGLRTELTKLMDKYVRPADDVNDDYYHVYIFVHDGKPDTFHDEFTYGWFVRIPGYTCANVHFDNKSKLFSHVDLIRRKDGSMVFGNPEELKTLIDKTFAGKSEEEMLQ